MTTLVQLSATRLKRWATATRASSAGGEHSMVVSLPVSPSGSPPLERGHKDHNSRFIVAIRRRG